MFYYAYLQPKKVHTFDYDSDEEESDDEEDTMNDEEYNTDVEDDGLIDEAILQKRIEEKRKRKAKLTEHFDSLSYPWLIMKLAMVELAMKNINDFISLAGLELSGIFRYLFVIDTNTRENPLVNIFMSTSWKYLDNCYKSQKE